MKRRVLVIDEDVSRKTGRGEEEMCHGYLPCGSGHPLASFAFRLARDLTVVDLHLALSIASLPLQYPRVTDVTRRTDIFSIGL